MKSGSDFLSKTFISVSTFVSKALISSCGIVSGDLISDFFLSGASLTGSDNFSGTCKKYYCLQICHFSAQNKQYLAS
jgi:hypothetical protein